MHLLCVDNGDMTHLHQSSGIGYRHLKPSVSKNLLDPGYFIFIYFSPSQPFSLRSSHDIPVTFLNAFSRDMKNMQDFEEKTKIQKDEQFIPDTEQVTGISNRYNLSKSYAFWWYTLGAVNQLSGSLKRDKKIRLFSFLRL